MRFKAKTCGILGAADSGTITCNRVKAPLYKNNVHDFNWGLHINGSELVSNNKISECHVGVNIYVTSGAVKFLNNYIHDNPAGMDINANTSTVLTISTNTFLRNQLAIYSDHPGLTLSNNIFFHAPRRCRGR